MRTELDPSGWGTLLIYELPVLALSTPFFLLQFFGLAFGTDVLGLPPARVGAILAAGRIWDALTDPLVGAWSDRTRSPWGRRRPWLLAVTPVVAASVILLWRPPAAPSGATIWLVGFVLLFTTAFTGWVIPHHGLGMELSVNPLSARASSACAKLRSPAACSSPSSACGRRSCAKANPTRKRSCGPRQCASSSNS